MPNCWPRIRADKPDLGHAALGQPGEFAVAPGLVRFGAYTSGAASEILQWPRFWFWGFVALSLVVFTLYATLRLVRIALAPAAPKPAPEASDGLV